MYYLADRKFAIPAYIERLLHPAAHVAAALACLSVVARVDTAHAISAIVGCLAPDALDDKQLGLDLQHRTITHSLLAIGVLLVAAYAAEPQDTIWLAIIAGYASHLLIDLTHGLGIMLWYPVSRSMVTLGHMPHTISIAISIIVTAYSVTAPTPAPVLIYAIADRATATVAPTRTPTLTPTPRNTSTATPTVTITRTPTPDYSASIAASTYQRARLTADEQCRRYGSNHRYCTLARTDEQSALLRYCDAAQLPVADCIPPTPTRTPTATPSATHKARYTPTPPTMPTAQIKSDVQHTPLCKTFTWIPC